MSMTRRSNRAISALVGSLASLLVILAVTLVLEVVLRTTHVFGARVAWTEPDDATFYRMTPGLPYWWFKENDHAIAGSINSLGWRDRERSLVKPLGHFRVCFLGDSILAAFEVETDSTFVAIAEDELNDRRGRAVEIMNLGLPGATQTEELIVLQRDVMRLSPDLVALFFNPGNDIGDVSRRTRGPGRPYFLVNHDGSLTLDATFSQSRQYRMRSAINGMKQRSALVSLMAERFNLFARSRRLGAAAAEARGFPRYLRLCTARSDSIYAQNYKLNKRLIREMATWCRERGVGFLLVCGSSAYEPRDVSRFREVEPSFDADFFERDLASYADSLGVEYLGLQSLFRAQADSGGQPLHWGHLSYRGHRVVAQALANAVDEIVSERSQHESHQHARD